MKGIAFAYCSILTYIYIYYFPFLPFQYLESNFSKSRTFTVIEKKCIKYNMIIIQLDFYDKYAANGNSLLGKKDFGDILRGDFHTNLMLFLISEVMDNGKLDHV